MGKRVFHGSSHIVERPIFGGGRTHNDYGPGFYCTEQLCMAQEWAVGIARDGFANVYDIDLAGLSILHLNSDEYSTLGWLAVLLENREFDVPSPLTFEAREYLLANFLPAYRDYDIITGYRADDSYFSFAQDFINGTISLRQLQHAMHLGKLGSQFVIKSQRAFERLTFIEAKEARAIDWYGKKQVRDQTARRDYLDLSRNKRKKGDIYVLQIIDEEMKPGDPRLR